MKVDAGGRELFSGFHFGMDDWGIWRLPVAERRDDNSPAIYGWVIAYCDYVLLDSHWAIQVEQARKRIRAGGASFHMAKVFSEKENGLETFLQELESVATCQPVETK